MADAQCPYCKEEIKAKAVICKHCRERVDWSREELAMAAISRRVQVVAAEWAHPGPVSPCTAWCHGRSPDKVSLNQCLDICKEIQAVAATAEMLQRELVVTFADIVWGGGDIDPLPFERAVRKRFSRPDRP